MVNQGITMRVRAVASLALLLFGAACAEPAPEAAPEAPSFADDEAAIRALVASFDEAVNNEDIDAMVSRYLEDAVRMTPNVPASVGRDAIRELFLANWEAADYTVANHIADLRISGDLAVARGTWTSHVVPADGSQPYDDEGKWTAVWERWADGSWMSRWDIWNSDLPPRPTQ